ncbi:MAG: arginase family protein [Lachnospiraceae bacterium]|nr:arginase family protein [Lachnospiraceae bacterium]
MKTILFDFSGMYPAHFHCDKRIDCRGIEGTNLYCSEEAEEEIRTRIRQMGAPGIHLIDHGNYHYVSKLFLDVLDEECDLVVFDHHTDMQAPGLFDLLSCGNWIRSAMLNNKKMQSICILGPSEQAFDEVEADLRERAHFLSEPKLKMKGREIGTWLRERLKSKNLWVSVDLDFLSKNVITTNWDQGNFSLQELKEMLLEVCSLPGLLGIDLCGGHPDTFDERSENVYEELLAFLQSFVKINDRD